MRKRVYLLAIIILPVLALGLTNVTEAIEYNLGEKGYGEYPTQVTLKVDGHLRPGAYVDIIVDDGGRTSYVKYGTLLDDKLKVEYLQPEKQFPTAPRRGRIRVPADAQQIVVKFYDFRSNFLPENSFLYDFSVKKFQKVQEYNAFSLPLVVYRVSLHPTIKNKGIENIIAVTAEKKEPYGHYIIRFKLKSGDEIAVLSDETAKIITLEENPE